MAQTSRSRQSKQTENIVLNHLQPQALELEEAVLGALMIEQDAFISVSDILKTESFYDNRHRAIYSAVSSLYISQRPIDILTVTEQLKSTGQLEEAGGAAYIARSGAGSPASGAGSGTSSSWTSCSWR